MAFSLEDARPDPASDRAQQRATRIIFFIAGLAVAAWAPLVPFAKARTHLDDAGLGLLLLCLGAGSLLAMPMAGAWAARSGCRLVLRITSLIVFATLPLLASIDAPLALGLALFVFGASIGALDCTMNVMAVQVERQAGTPMLAGIHAWYSVGGLAGAAATTMLLSAGLSPLTVTLAVVVVLLALYALAAPYWRDERAPRDGPAFARPRGVVWLIGFACLVSFLAEGAMLDWSAVLLVEDKGMAPRHAGAGFALFSVAMTAVRLGGDALIRRWGLVRNVVAGAIAAGVGLLLTAFAPGPASAALGCAIVGAGAANVVPALFSLAGQQTAMPASVAIPAVTTLGYAGILAGPALIGFVAHASSLPLALAGVAIALSGVALLARRLPR
ncbi:MAG: MFS transporter [Burkholderiaceae bacterium]